MNVVVTNPLVSVIIPAYRARATLSRALASVEAQTYPNLEVIVVEDGSDDGSARLVKAYTAHPARYFRLPINQGVAAARNRGLEEAKGTFIAFLDADDEWVASKIAEQIGVMRAHPQASLVACAASRINERGWRAGRINAHARVVEGPEAWRHLLAENFFCTPTVLCRREDVAAAGGFDPALQIGEDQDLWIRLARRGSVRFIDKELVRVHVLSSGLSARKAGLERDITLPMIERHLARFADELAPEEILAIKARRQLKIGQQLYVHKKIGEGISLLRQAAKHPSQKTAALRSTLSLCPPVHATRSWLKSALGRARRPRLPKAPDARLIVTIDTEEEFDWSDDFSRNARSVDCIQQIDRLQSIFERYDIHPTYVVDYPVIEDTAATGVLRRLSHRGVASIGAHLHPWVTPPYSEDVDPRNSYPGNLPPALECEKIRALTDQIEDCFGERPIIYKAGRNGFGPRTAECLKALGYRIDTSFLPFTSLKADGGPDFSNTPAAPHWLGEKGRLLEIPHTVGFTGLLAGMGPALMPLLETPTSAQLKVPGVLSRLGLLSRIRLTPEGLDLPDLLSLLRTRLLAGDRLFHLSLHSSSLIPGGSPYAETEAEVETLLARIDNLLWAFTEEAEGRGARHTDLLVTQAPELPVEAALALA